MYGAGSWNSPIYISDDEDEATVELELERRLASPRDDYEYEDDWNSYENAVDARLWGEGHMEYYSDDYDDYQGAPSVLMPFLTPLWRPFARPRA